MLCPDTLYDTPGVRVLVRFFALTGLSQLQAAVHLKSRSTFGPKTRQDHEAGPSNQLQLLIWSSGSCFKNTRYSKDGLTTVLANLPHKARLH